jgi:hypothetical protein
VVYFYFDRTGTLLICHCQPGKIIAMAGINPAVRSVENMREAAGSRGGGIGTCEESLG